MGLILDTSILIDAEHRGLAISRMLEELPVGVQDDVAVSVMSLMELAHGNARARTEAIRLKRSLFLADLQTAVPSVAVTQQIAIRAGRLDGALRAARWTLGVADVVIASTALVRKDRVVTLNVKHFELVPEIEVVQI